MSISRHVYELWEASQSREPRIDVFSDRDIQQLQQLPEYGRAATALERQTDNPHLAIMLALRSLSMQRHDFADQLSDAELVLTIPQIVSTGARPTYYVIREMIESARVEVILAGYRITSEDILGMLQDAARRGVRVLMICGRADGDAQKVLFSWSQDAPPPSIFQDVRRGSDDSPLMHIKALLVDSTQLLISSANFTYSGMARNIEFGIRTNGRPAVEAKTVLMQLVKSRLFEEYRAGPR